MVWCGITSFNTVNGRYYCLIIFIWPSLRLGTWDMLTSSSLCASAVSHPSAHTESDKNCCNLILGVHKLTLTYSFNTVNGKSYCNNSFKRCMVALMKKGFNTVTGKFGYSIIFVLPSLRSGTWDVRASSSRCPSAASHPSAHTVNGKHCCNCYWFQ